MRFKNILIIAGLLLLLGCASSGVSGSASESEDFYGAASKDEVYQQVSTGSASSFIISDSLDFVNHRKNYGTLSGQVLGLDGQPIQNVRVVFNNPHFYAVRFTDEEGRFEVALLDTTYKVVLYDDESCQIGREKTLIFEGQNTSGVELFLDLQDPICSE